MCRSLFHSWGFPQAGSAAASERLQFESRMRRLKLSCSRWKTAFQREMHAKYQDLSSAMEERYVRFLAPHSLET